MSSATTPESKALGRVNKSLEALVKEMRTLNRTLTRAVRNVTLTPEQVEAIINEESEAHNEEEYE